MLETAPLIESADSTQWALGSHIDAVDQVRYQTPDADLAVCIRSIAIGFFTTLAAERRRYRYQRFGDESAHLYAYLDGPAGGASGGCRLCLAGPFTGGVPEALQGCGHVIDIALDPTALVPLFGKPAKELSGRLVPLGELWGPAAAGVGEQLAALDDWRAQAQALQDRLRGRDLDRETSLYLQEATRMIRESDGDIRCAELARRIGYSSRQLRRIFDAGLGVSPKHYARCARIMATVRRALADPSRDWAQLCQDAGYYDQSHCSHDFRSLIGLPPEGFLRMLRQSALITRSPESGAIEVDRPTVFADPDPASGISVLQPID